MCFSAYNELFSVAKGADETLPAVASCIENALARVVNQKSELVGFVKNRRFAVEILKKESDWPPRMNELRENGCRVEDDTSLSKSLCAFEKL
jgi:hypothetical protein